MLIRFNIWSSHLIYVYPKLNNIYIVNWLQFIYDISVSVSTFKINKLLHGYFVATSNWLYLIYLNFNLNYNT